MFLLNRFKLQHIPSILSKLRLSSLSSISSISSIHNESIHNEIKVIESYTISPQQRQKYLPTILLFYKQNLIETYEKHNIYFFTFEFTTIDEKRGCKKLFDVIKQQK